MRFALTVMLKSIGRTYMKCFRSSVVERTLGKGEVKSSILFGSSIVLGATLASILTRVSSNLFAGLITGKFD